MRRTEQEFKAEILRREKAYRAKCKRMRQQLIGAAACLVLIMGGIVTLWQPVIGGAAKAADSYSMNMAPQSPEILMDGEIPASYEPAAEAAPADVCPCVMVDGVLYFDTGYYNPDASVSASTAKIDSQVPGNRVPTEDNQSNFGVGYDYRYGEAEGTIEVLLNGKWRIYATEEVKNSGDYLD